MSLSSLSIKITLEQTAQAFWQKLLRGPGGKFFEWLGLHGGRCLDFLVLGLYFWICFVTLQQHEPWRDEAMPWLMARDSSFSELFFYNLRYELHPLAWYLVLFITTHLGVPYFGLLLVHLLIAWLAMSLLVLKAPLPRIVKYAFAFSYYMMSEYVLIARHYSLSILALFCVASCYRTRFQKPLLYGAAVLFLFNTEYLCASTGIGLLLFYAFDIFRKNPIRKKQIAGFGLMLLGCAMMVLQVLRIASDQDYIPAGKGMNPPGLMRALSRVFLPVSWDMPESLALGIGLIVLIAAFIYLLRRPRMALLMSLCYAGPFYIFLFKHHHAELSITRHYGFIVMFLLFLLWIDRVASAEKPEGRTLFASRQKVFSWLFVFLMTALTAGFLFSIKYTYFTHRMDRALPYSGGKMMAEAIQVMAGKTYGENEIIVGYPHGYMASIIPYLPHQKFWDPQRRSFKSFAISKLLPPEDRELKPQEVIVRAGLQFQDISKLLFVFIQQLPFSEAFGYTFVPVFAADRGVWGVGLERFYLYKPVRKASGPDLPKATQANSF